MFFLVRLPAVSYVNVVTRFTPDTPEGSVIVAGSRYVGFHVVAMVRAIGCPEASVRDVSRLRVASYT
jgi:hypothetical protein